MNKINKNESGFSVVEVILVVVIVALIGSVGWLVYNNHHKTTTADLSTTSSTTKPATSTPERTTTTAIPSIVTPSITYAECTQTAGHGSGQIGYIAGTSQNVQGEILNVCNTPNGDYAADTTNSTITPIQLSTTTNFSAISDPNLKKTILASSEFTNAGCESNGSIHDNDILISAYIASHFMAVSPRDCAGQGAFGPTIYVDTNGVWSSVWSEDSGPSQINCSTISQYKMPILFVLEGGGGSGCTVSSGTYKDLVSGIIT
jgi:Tfp pilus assembly protein PilE